MEKTKMPLIYYFLYYGFSYLEWTFDFYFWIFISGTQKTLPDIGMYYFLFRIFISGIKIIFGIF